MPKWAQKSSYLLFTEIRTLGNYEGGYGRPRMLMKSGITQVVSERLHWVAVLPGGSNQHINRGRKSCQGSLLRLRKPT